MRLVVTGHRPDKTGGYSQAAKEKLRAFAKRELAAQQPSEVITGMALGWDQAIARSCVELKVPFVAAVPFEGQELTWPLESRVEYWSLLDKAERVEIVGKSKLREGFLARNVWMMEQEGVGLVMALWNGTRGGTEHAIRMARERGLRVENVWGRWIVEQRRGERGGSREGE